MKRPTITDIAREAGVSKGAVSYALNGRPGVSEATRHRITRIARELGWSPSSTARALSGGRAGAIGLVLDGPSEPVVPALLDGLSEELLVQVAPSRDAASAVYRRWRAERKVDGVLLTAPDHAAELLRIGLPAVVLGGPGGLPGVPSVLVDDTAGAEEALEYLAALGHRHVVRIPGAAAFAEPAERAEAFAAESRRLGLTGAGESGGGVRRSGRGEGAGPAGLPTAAAEGRGGGPWGGGRREGGRSFGGRGEAGGPFGGQREVGGLFGADPAANSAVRSAGPADRGSGTPAGFGDRAQPPRADPATGSGTRSGNSADRGGAGAGVTGIRSGNPADRGRASAWDTGPRSRIPADRGGAGPAGAGVTETRSGIPADRGGAGARATGTRPSADAVRLVLTAHPRPTALLCDTDCLAVAALVAARELGLAVPGELSVVSWDDSDLCRLVRPALSAIRRPLVELGGLSVSMLRDLIAGEEVGDVRASRPRLITRGSTGPAR